MVNIYNNLQPQDPARTQHRELSHLSVEIVQGQEGKFTTRCCTGCDGFRRRAATRVVGPRVRNATRLRGPSGLGWFGQVAQMFALGCVGLGLVEWGQVGLGWVRSVWVRLGKVRLMLGQVGSDWVWLGLVGLGSSLVECVLHVPAETPLGGGRTCGNADGLGLGGAARRHGGAVRLQRPLHAVGAALVAVFVRHRLLRRGCVGDNTGGSTDVHWAIMENSAFLTAQRNRTAI